MIERRVATISEVAEQWRMRLTLLRKRGRYKTLLERARELIPSAKKPPTPGIRFTRSTSGLRTMTVTADEHLLADIERTLNDDLDPSSPSTPQMLSAFERVVRVDDSDGDDCSCTSDCTPAGDCDCNDCGCAPGDGDCDDCGGGCDGCDAGDCGCTPGAPEAGNKRGGRSRGVKRSSPEPLILVPLPTHIQIMEGRGDDIELRLTNGTTMTGAEYVNGVVAKHAKPFQLGLFHPEEGPVNLYRESRFANDKQRKLLRAAMPMCLAPGCRKSADQCQFHHMTAWKHGGETNLKNLAVLCRYHNQINDDDPGVHRRGRPEAPYGTPVWVSPRGYPVSNCDYGAMNLLFGITGLGPRVPRG
ncbi:HNH endonuclease [Corynebacterium aquatimens]